MGRIDIAGWGRFPLGGEAGMFDIKKGTRLTRADMRPGKTNYIGASGVNNGVTNRISNNERLHPGNTITVSYNGTVGEAFYQPEEFWATDDVNVLYPRFDMDESIALFICPLIRCVGRNYVYLDKWKQDDMKTDEIYLPVCEDGSPDWEYMRDYMRKMMLEANSALGALIKCARGA